MSRCTRHSSPTQSRPTCGSGGSTSTACRSSCSPGPPSCCRRRRRVNALNYGDLLNLTVRVLRHQRSGAPRAPAQVPVSVRGRVPGHRSCSGRIVFLLAADEAGVAGALPRAVSFSRPLEASAGRSPARKLSVFRIPIRTAGPGLARSPAPPGRALRRRRPQAVHLSLPSCRHRDLQHRPRPFQRLHRVGAAADDELPVGAGAVRVGERGVRAAVPG